MVEVGGRLVQRKAGQKRSRDTVGVLGTRIGWVGGLVTPEWLSGLYGWAALRAVLVFLPIGANNFPLAWYDGWVLVLVLSGSNFWSFFLPSILAEEGSW